MSFSFLDTFASKTAGHVLFGIGIFSLSAIIYLQYNKISTTKNTVGLSKGFLYGQLLACFFLVIASSFRLATGAKVSDTVSVNGSLIASGISLFCINIYTLKVKLANIAAAKKAGLTEAEHYESAIVPTLQLNSTINNVVF